MKTKKKYEFGAGLHSRIPQSYKVMIVWAALDQGTMKAFWKSVKGVCPKDAKSATQIRKDALDKFKAMLKKKKFKKTHNFCGMDYIFPDWFKTNVKPFLK